MMKDNYFLRLTIMIVGAIALAGFMTMIGAIK
jgi:hypothetical protein